MTQIGLFDETHHTAVLHNANTKPRSAQAQSRAKKAWNVPDPQATDTQIEAPKSTETITLDGRDYRHHRDSGDHVWLKSPESGIGGPFYWVCAEEVRSAQRRLAAVAETGELDGPEYEAALGEMARAMREGR